MALGMQVGLGPAHIVLDGDPAPLPNKEAEPPIFGPFLLFWPNGWMHQDATWYGGMPPPRRLCFRWGPRPLLPKGAEPPILDARLLWPNGFMDQDAWLKIMDQDLSLGLHDIVLDGDPDPPPLKGHGPPIFGHCPLWQNGWMDQDATWYGCRPRPRRHCVRCGPSYLHKEMAHPPQPIFGPCLLWPTGWMDDDAAWYGSRPRPRPHCIRRSSSSPRKRHSSPPSFRPMFIVATVAHLIYCRALV